MESRIKEGRDGSKKTSAPRGDPTSRDNTSEDENVKDRDRERKKRSKGHGRSNVFGAFWHKRFAKQPRVVGRIIPSASFGITERVGMDIGGTLTKFVYIEPVDSSANGDMVEIGANDTEALAHKFMKDAVQYGESGIRDKHLEMYAPSFMGRMHFVKFQTQHFDRFITILKGFKIMGGRISATGGGAHKFEHPFKAELNLVTEKEDELETTVQGIVFMLRLDPETECFQIADSNFSFGDKVTVKPFPLLAPGLKNRNHSFLVVNIGSGVSILLVEPNMSKASDITLPCKFSRVGGSSLGGATFFGLCRILTKCESFQEALELATRGENSNVDMLVKDIYGGSYDKFDLSATTLASSFGKMVKGDLDKCSPPSREDLARATLIMITMNVAAIAALHAQMRHIDKIVFAGNFLVNNNVSMRTLAHAVEHVWSKGPIELKALFLRHEGYFGAVGALLKSVNRAGSRPKL